MVDGSGIRGLLRHELLQYAANKKQLASLVVGVILLLTLLGMLCSAVVAEQQLMDSQESNVLRERFPGYGDEAILLGGLGGIVLSFAMLFICGVHPALLGATAVVGEKEHRTLESLLLLPVSDMAILLAKIVPAVLLPLAACWLCCGVAVSIALMLFSSQALHPLLDPEFAVTVLLTAPAVASMSALLAAIPSVLVADTDAAQKFSVIPATGIMVVLLALYGVFVIFENRSVILVTLCVLALDVVLFTVAVRLFNRERLLLRY